MRQIYKTIFREFRFEKKRTFILFVVFFIIVAAPIAMFSIDPSIKTSINESNQNYQLAHIHLGFQGTVESIQSSFGNLTSNNHDYADVIYDFHPTSNVQLNQGTKWYKTDIVGLNTSSPPVVNKISFDNNYSVLQNDTAFILESYADELGVGLGDNITIYPTIGKRELEIVGLVKSIEYLSFDLSFEGAIFVNYQTFQELQGWSEMYLNSMALYFPNDPDLDFLKQFVDDLSEEIQVTYVWYVREFSISSLFQDVLSLTSQVLFVMACAIILGAGIVIFLITKRYAVEQRKQTGMLYAFGFKPKIILRVFMLRTLIISLIAIVIGIAGSYGLLQLMVRILISRWGIPLILARFSTIGLIVVPALVILSSQIFTYFACRSNVKMTPYEAIRGKSEYKVKNKRMKKTPAKNKSPISISFKYPLRNLSRNKVRGILITGAFIGAISISFALIQTNTNINSTFDTYFDEQIHWDIQTRFTSYKTETEIQSIFSAYDFISKYELYMEGNALLPDKPEYGLELRGIEPNSTLYEMNLQEGSLFTNATTQEGIISSYSAKPLGIEVGDYLNFTTNGVDFTIKIVGVVRDLDIPNSLFMLIPALEETLGYSKINTAFVKLNTTVSDAEAVNAALSDLNEDAEIRYAILKDSYEARMVHMVNTQLFIIKVTIVLALVISFLIIFVTAFVSIIERTREIALQRTFGFQKSQIFFQIVFEIGMLIVIAALFGIAVGGEGLGRMIQYFIGQFFFELDSAYFWGDYLMIIGFSIVCVFLSTLPSINLLRKQKLATAIIE
jgi:putative ABC transport system permease protein